MGLQTLEMRVKCHSSLLRISLAAAPSCLCHSYLCTGLWRLQSLPDILKRENGKKAVPKKANYLNFWEERGDSCGDSRHGHATLLLSWGNIPEARKQPHKVHIEGSKIGGLRAWITCCLLMDASILQRKDCQLQPFGFLPRWIQSQATEEQRLTKHKEIKWSMQGVSEALLLNSELSIQG